MAARTPRTRSRPIPEPAVIYGFGLDGDDREKLLGILRRGNRARDRIAALTAMGRLARDQYEEWRRKRPGEHDYETRLDIVAPWQKFAAAVFQRGLRPTQIFEYWGDPEHNFTPMDHPAYRIAFVCSVNMVDAACEEIRSGGRPGTRAPPQRVDALHAYNPRSLHPDLRRTLEDAGHDVSEKTDRALMTVQVYARALAAGRSPYISPERAELGRAAKHLFVEAPRAD